MKSTRSHVIITVGYVTDRSRNQFKQLINKGFYFVDGSAINTEKERFYSNTRIMKKSTASQRMFWGLVDITDYLKVGLRDI